MSEKGKYFADAATRDRPLRVEEVEALLMAGGKSIARHEDNVVHLLHRVAATLRDHRSRMSTLSQDVDRIKVEKESRAHPMAKAVEALAQLTDEQKRQLLDANYVAEMDRLRRSREELELARTAALNETNRVRFTLAALLDDEEIPAMVRQKIANSLARLTGGHASG